MFDTYLNKDNDSILLHWGMEDSFMFNLFFD
nr:MAG TPA: hypothetical protein [Caudoviricetes sp.]